MTMHNHDDTILTHMLGAFAEKLCKSDDGLKRVKWQNKSWIELEISSICDIPVPIGQCHHHVECGQKKYKMTAGIGIGSTAFFIVPHDLSIIVAVWIFGYEWLKDDNWQINSNTYDWVINGDLRPSESKSVWSLLPVPNCMSLSPLLADENEV